SGSGWTASGQVLTADPSGGLSLEQLGNVTVSAALDLDQSAGGGDCSCGDGLGDAALVYNSDSVSVKPIIAAAVQTGNAQARPATTTAQSTWNGGTPQTAPQSSTTGSSPGDVLPLAQQVSSVVSTTGRYPYSLQVTMDYGTPIVRTVTGTAYVVS